MKTKSAICIFFMSFVVHYNCYPQVAKVSLIKIEFEGFFTETIANIDCDKFRTVFKESMKIKTISNENDLLRFKTLANSFRPCKPPLNIDIRGVITFFGQPQSKAYCFDTFGTFYNNGKAYRNVKLLSLISDDVYGNHPEYLDTLDSKLKY